MQIISSIMFVRIVGRTVRYRYRKGGGEYEIRGVAETDMAQLLAADARGSGVSATVQAFTHAYRRSHYREDGTLAPPASESRSSLERKASGVTGPRRRWG